MKNKKPEETYHHIIDKIKDIDIEIWICKIWKEFHSKKIKEYDKKIDTQRKKKFNICLHENLKHFPKKENISPDLLCYVECELCGCIASRMHSKENYNLFLSKAKKVLYRNLK